MKKPLIIALITVGVLISLFSILGITNILKLYSIPTTANEPGIKVDSKIFTSSLKKYKNGDFICYNYVDKKIGKHVRVHRLIGMEEDIIEIKDGVLYLNNQNFDKDLELMHFYLLEKDEFEYLKNNGVIGGHNLSIRMDDKIMIALLDTIANEYQYSTKIKNESKNQNDPIIEAIYDEKWNIDNFGPLLIPKGKCFVIGDNRHNSEDSRYIGLIDVNDILGTVL